MNATKSVQSRPAQINLWLDGALFAALMLALAPALTGLAIHEWLSLALAVAVLVHLLLHWAWIAAAVRRFWGRLSGQARVNLALNVLLFIDFVVVTFTGVLISREALPLFGITLTGGRTWEGLHRQSADLLVFIAGLHVALHWKWILSAVKRYLIRPILNLGRKPAVQASPVATPAAFRQEAK